MKKTFITLCCMIATSVSVLKAQHFEGNSWCFGQGARVDFSTNTPYSPSSTSLTSGFNSIYGNPLSANEGVASVSNNKGQLLFYTDGQKVYLSNNSVMSNGTGLLGHNSSTQSAIIVPKPGATLKSDGTATEYYIFTVDQVGGENSIMYTIVDNTGTLPVVSSTRKNVSLPGIIDNVNGLDGKVRFAEKITAIKKSTDFGFYLIAQKAQIYNSNISSYSNQFYVWEINCKEKPGGDYGINLPIVQTIGSNYCLINDGSTKEYTKDKYHYPNTIGY